MNAHYLNLRAKHATHLENAKTIATRVESERRDFTADERREVEQHLSDAKSLEPAMRQAKADAEVRQTLAGLGDPYPSSSTGTRLAAHAADGRAWGKSVATHLVNAARTTGVKSLTSGSIDIPSPVATEVGGLPQQPRLIDLLIDRQQLAGNSFEYLRQTARVNNAAPVADNALKPTSTFTVTPIEDRARVVAHISDPFPERFLSDYDALGRWLSDEMHEGVLQALEGEILGGDGTGEHFAGLLATSGTVAVPYAVDAFTTIRRARTALQVLGEKPSAWVMHPTDLEAIDLTEDGTGRLYLADGNGTNALFGGLPRIASTRIPAGQAILADWAQMRLYVREAVRLDFDKSGTLFTRNEVVARAEGRFGWAVLRPQAAAIVDLTP